MDDDFNFLPAVFARAPETGEVLADLAEQVNAKTLPFTFSLTLSEPPAKSGPPAAASP